MPRFSVLLGSSPEDYRQKKIEEMFDFLDSKKSAGDSIVAFANGISEIMLEMVLDNSVKQKPGSIFLYICTLQTVGESEESIWLGGEEIRKDVIEHYQELAAECGIDMQVIFDSDSEMVSEDELGWEKVIEPVEITTQETLRSSAKSAGEHIG